MIDGTPFEISYFSAVCGARTADPRSQECAWIEGGRSTPCRRGKAPASTKRPDEQQSLVMKRSTWKDDDSARPNSDTTVQYAPWTGTMPPPEAGSKIWERIKACEPPRVLTAGAADIWRAALIGVLTTGAANIVQARTGPGHPASGPSKAVNGAARQSRPNGGPTGRRRENEATRNERLPRT